MQVPFKTLLQKYKDDEMTSVFISFLLIFMMAFCAYGQEWKQPSKGEIAAITITEVLIATDIAMTVNAMKRGSYEINPILGSHPSTERVIAFGVIGGVSSLVLWYWLPSKVRYLVPAVVGSIELEIVIGQSFGLRMPI
jgi:hypothetical protein